MKLSIIVPVYNEEKTIKQIINKIKNVHFSVEIELVIVDDGSKDNTKKILEEYVGKEGFNVIFKENGGKGSAIRTGLAKATGDVIAIQDADLEYDPYDIPKLLQPILEKKTKVVYGSRFIRNDGFAKNRLISHDFGNKILNLATNLLYCSSITDMETCYKLFTSDVISKIKLNSNGFEIEPEITAKLLKAKHAIMELPISFAPRSHAEGKKIKKSDGIKALYYLLKYRFFD